MGKRRQLNRDRVIEKAVELVDGSGDARSLSLTTLAQALEIRPPSLYNHVTSLEDLQYGMALFGVQQLMANLRQASLDLIGRDALVAVAMAYRQFAHRHPGIYPLTIRAPESGETELANLAQELMQMLQLMMASMGLQGEDAIHAIRGLRAILHGFVSLEAADGYKMALELGESFQRLVYTYLEGLLLID